MPVSVPSVSVPSVSVPSVSVPVSSVPVPVSVSVPWVSVPSVSVPVSSVSVSVPGCSLICSGRVGGGGVGDDLGVGVHSDVALVAVEASRGALAAVAGVGIDRGYDTVRCDTTRDAHPPVGALLEVLAQDRGQQLNRLGGGSAQVPPLHRREHRRGVRGEPCHQRLTRSGVLPVAIRLRSRRVSVAAAKHRPQLLLKAPRSRRRQRPTHRAGQHRDSVLSGHRVIHRRRVEHPPQRQRPRLAGRVERHIEDPPRAPRSRQTRPHAHQHRMAEPPRIERQTTARVLPARIELERRHRLTIRQPEPALEHHHRRHHPRRHTATPTRRKQISEQRIREQPIPLTEQQPENRPLRHPAPHKTSTGVRRCRNYGEVVATVMVLQALEGLSDRQACPSAAGD